MDASDRPGPQTAEDGLIRRMGRNPWAIVAVAFAVLLVLGWIGWAVYVTSDQGLRHGLGVLIAWPALLAAAALIVLPFVGVYLLTRGSGEQDAEDEPRLTEPG